MSMLRLKVLTKECGKSWNDFAAQGLKNKEALADMHEQLLQTELRFLNRKFVAGLWNNLFGLHPRVEKFADRGLHTGAAHLSFLVRCRD